MKAFELFRKGHEDLRTGIIAAIVLALSNTATAIDFPEENKPSVEFQEDENFVSIRLDLEGKVRITTENENTGETYEYPVKDFTTGDLIDILEFLEKQTDEGLAVTKDLTNILEILEKQTDEGVADEDAPLEVIRTIENYSLVKKGNKFYIDNGENVGEYMDEFAAYFYINSNDETFLQDCKDEF